MNIKLNRFKLNNSGTTLIEILIVMGLLSVMLVVIATIFTSSADVQKQSNSYSATISNGRFIMARLNYDIAHASSVITPSTFGATNSSLEIVVGGNDYTYSLSGNNLQLTDNIGTDNLNSDDVHISGLSFQEIGASGINPSIQYSFTATSVSHDAGNYDTQTFTSSEDIR